MHLEDSFKNKIAHDLQALKKIQAFHGHSSAFT